MFSSGFSKKYKSPGLQFQGKLKNEETAYSVFATPAGEEDDETNQAYAPSSLPR
jgi:hypothetical protein